MLLKKKGYDGCKALLSGYLPFQGENVMRIYSKSFKANYAFSKWISPRAENLMSNLLRHHEGPLVSNWDHEAHCFFHEGVFR
ncbi:hypothetical protein AAZV13_14G145400 [Glycine max]